jgi:hypothetical protein
MRALQEQPAGGEIVEVELVIVEADEHLPPVR